MPLTIGINALYLLPGGVGGTEIYARNLLPAMVRAAPEHRFAVITNRETKDLVTPAANVIVLPQRVPARVRPARILWEQIGVPVLAARHRFSVLLNPGFTAPMVCPCPQVTVFHDLQHKRHPEYFRWFDLPFWTVLLSSAARRSERLIAVSDTTRQDLLKYYGRDASVVGHGVESEIFDLADRRAPEPFILCVSTLHPHKGIETLLGAFGKFHKRYPHFRLVLVGMRGFAAAGIEQRISDLRLNGIVDITGWIPRAQVLDLYRRAFVFVYASRFEGFGMPVAEAMAAGVPVVCSDIEPLRSVCAGSAGLVPPGDEDALGAALEALTADEGLRERRVAEGRARAAAFTWQEAASKTLSVLEQVAKVRL